MLLFKDKFIFKPPQASGHGAHQDMQFGWHRFIHDGLSCMIAFDDSNEETVAMVAGARRSALPGAPPGSRTASATCASLRVG